MIQSNNLLHTFIVFVRMSTLSWLIQSLTLATLFHNFCCGQPSYFFATFYFEEHISSNVFKTI